MKILKTLMCAAAVVLGARAGVAQVVHVWDDPHAWWGGHFVYGPAVPDKFTANEFSLDAFGSFNAGESKFSHLFQTNIRRGKWGGGLGLNYFLTREIGIGGDVNMPANGGHLVDSVLGSLILRLPSERTGLAPYIFGGGGRGTDRVWQWLGHAGVGLEWRLNPVTGVFTDGRYIWADKTSDALMLRAGLRFIF